MRAVVAKRLRKQAREATIGMPERQLLAVQGGKPNRVTAVNDPQTFRGMYLIMKKAYNR